MPATARASPPRSSSLPRSRPRSASAAHPRPVTSHSLAPPPAIGAPLPWPEEPSPRLRRRGTSPPRDPEPDRRPRSIPGVFDTLPPVTLPSVPMVGLANVTTPPHGESPPHRRGAPAHVGAISADPAPRSTAS